MKVLDALASPLNFASHWVIGWAKDQENSGEWNHSDLSSLAVVRFDTAAPIASPLSLPLLPSSEAEITVRRLRLFSVDYN